MKTINRTVLTISPRQPYINWANSFEDDGPKLESGEIYSAALLIPDRYDETNFEEFIKKNYSMIFKGELVAWMADPDAWPKNRTYKKFKEWFEVNVSDTVIDYGIDPIIIEEL